MSNLTPIEKLSAVVIGTVLGLAIVTTAFTPFIYGFAFLVTAAFPSVSQPSWAQSFVLSLAVCIVLLVLSPRKGDK